MAIDNTVPDCPANDGAPLDWHIVHQRQIAAYNAWAEQRPTFSASVQAWRDSKESEIPA